MGSGIAGQVANAGIEVWLLDLPTDDNPNALAQRGLERLLDPNQPGLISKEAESLIHLGNTRDDFDQLADCDWIAEAVVERLDIKKRPVPASTRDLPRQCDYHVEHIDHSDPPAGRGYAAVVSPAFCDYALFQPGALHAPARTGTRRRYQCPAVIDLLADFCEQQLGKGVVVACRDTPGFLGNRVGVFAIQCALQAAFELGLTPLEADAIFGRPMGFPKTGVFGLYDLIGIDLMSDVVQSLVSILPETDPFHAEAASIPLMTQMIANGQTGNKQGQGFYRDVETGREVLNLGLRQLTKPRHA